MKKMKLPNTYSILFLLMLLFAFLTWVLPTGSYDRNIDPITHKEVVVSNTYHLVDANPQGFMSVMTSFCRGIVDSAEIIAFVLIVGGAYGVIMSTGAIDQALQRLIHKLANKSFLLIPVIMTMFAIGGTTTGTWEETLPFFIIIIPLIIRAGYDALVGLAVIILGASAGVIASTLNPFSTGIASSIAQITIKDGLSTRIIAWFIVLAISIVYVMIYAFRIKKNPTKSIVNHLHKDHETHFANLHAPVNLQNKMPLNYTIIVMLFCSMIIFMMYSISQLGWWIAEITMLYLSLSIASAILTKMSQNQFWHNFINGAKDLIPAALIIALAKGVVLIAQDGFIIDTILYYASTTLNNLSSTTFIVLNQAIQTLFALVVPSSSAQAALTMPIMAPLADLVHISRENVVSTMQFSSGLANMVTPTSGVLMGAIAIARVSLIDWLKFVLPLFAILFVTTVSILIWNIS